jgi:hypothetical protein
MEAGILTHICGGKGFLSGKARQISKGREILGQISLTALAEVMDEWIDRFRSCIELEEDLIQ